MAEATILCVDDEPHILNSLRRLLRKENYQVLTADTVHEGLELLKSHQVQLIISDQRMPDMSGVEFLQKAKDLSYDTVRIILSGYADVALIVDSINKGEIFRFLSKPWNDEELKAAIRQCLAHYYILQQNRSLHEQIQAQNRKLRLLNLNMEEMVQLRTRSLHLAQEILEKLPFPVVGISSEGMVVQTNRAAEQLVDSLGTLAPGTDMNDVLPEQAVQAVSHRLAGNPEPATVPVTWDRKNLQLRIETLSDNGAIRGCMLIMSERDDR